MKNFFCIVAIAVFTATLAMAQSTPPTPPTPPSVTTESTSSTRTTSTTSSKTKININMDGDQRLKLRSDDRDFDMDLDFKKVSTQDIRTLLVKHLGQPNFTAGRKEIWTNKTGTYKIKLSKGNIDISIDKEITSRAHEDKLMAFAKDVFNLLDWDVDVDSL